MFHALNARLQQAEQRCRGLHYALQHQKRRTEQIMRGNTRKKRKEIKLNREKGKEKKIRREHEDEGTRFFVVVVELITSCSSSEVVSTRNRIDADDCY